VFSLVDAILAYLRKCSVFISGRNFGLFVPRECCICNGGRNFGSFVLRKCSVFISGRNFGLFTILTHLAYLH
jgi:hypothetical protein